MKVYLLESANLVNASKNLSQCRLIASLSEDCEHCSIASQIFTHQVRGRLKITRFPK
jgi:hypothetical protein